MAHLFHLPPRLLPLLPLLPIHGRPTHPLPPNRRRRRRRRPFTPLEAGRRQVDPFPLRRCDLVRSELRNWVLPDVGNHVFQRRRVHSGGDGFRGWVFVVQGRR